MTPLQRLQKQALLDAVTDQLDELERRPRLTNYLRRRWLGRLGEELFDQLGFWESTADCWQIRRAD